VTVDKLMSCEDLCTGSEAGIYMSLRGQVRARAYAYTYEPSYNNASSQCRDRGYNIVRSAC
jgi:hypothetical protein